MKKIFTLFIALIMISGSVLAQGISKEERKKALMSLKDSQAELLETIKGLSANQLNFKPAEDAWSIAECVEHIAISEKNIFGIVEMTLQQPADPARRSEVNMTDDQVVGLISSRERKVKTREEFEPTNSFGSYEETLDAFVSRRKDNMKFVKTTDEDLRNRYFEFPFGLVDSYQVVLFMSGHTVRHTKQIKEILESGDFPSS